MENFADIVNDRLWPGLADEDSKFPSEKLSLAELKDGKFRKHPTWPVMVKAGL